MTVEQDKDRFYRKNQYIALYHTCDAYIQTLTSNPLDNRIVKNLEALKNGLNKFLATVDFTERIGSLEVENGEVVCEYTAIIKEQKTSFKSFLSSITKQLYLFTLDEGGNSPA